MGAGYDCALRLLDGAASLSRYAALKGALKLLEEQARPRPKTLNRARGSCSRRRSFCVSFNWRRDAFGSP
jgi:hypothetical protein